MLRLRKNKGLLHTIRDRETGIGGSPQALGFNIIRLLVVSRNSDFLKVWHHRGPRRVCCENGYLYIRDFSVCISFWWLRRLYYFEARPGKKVDCLTCSGRNICNVPGPLDISNPATYRGFLLAVSDNNWLRSYDNMTGKVLQELYLGPTVEYKYRHVLWETFADRVMVTCNVIKPASKNLTRNHIYASILIFTLFPLEFLAKMEICSDVFGRGVQKINVDMGMLIIGKGTGANSHIYIYNLEHVLDNNITFQSKLNEPFPGRDGYVVGEYPVGLPFNCPIKSLPPLLFETKCSDYAVHFGAIPWHYMVQNLNDRMYEIYDVETGEAPLNNTLSCEETGFEMERAFFHFDYTDRIIYETPNEIRFYKINRLPDQNRCSVDQTFSINFLPDLVLKTTRSRSLRRLVVSNYFCAMKSIMCMDYEDQLELIAVLGFDPCDAQTVGRIQIYDNYTGKYLKGVELTLIIDETLKYELSFNLDTIVITHNTLDRRHCAIAYRLYYPAERKKM